MDSDGSEYGPVAGSCEIPISVKGGEFQNTKLCGLNASDIGVLTLTWLLLWIFSSAPPIFFKLD
jgi:hypothetical protein